MWEGSLSQNPKLCSPNPLPHTLLWDAVHDDGDPAAAGTAATVATARDWKAGESIVTVSDSVTGKKFT